MPQTQSPHLPRRTFSKAQFEAIGDTLNREVRRRSVGFEKTFKNPEGLVRAALESHRRAGTFPSFLTSVSTAETNKFRGCVEGTIYFRIHDDPAYVALRRESMQYNAEMSDAVRAFLGDIAMNGIPVEVAVDNVFAAAEAAHDARVKALNGTVLRLSRPKTATLKKKAAKTNSEIGKLAKRSGGKA